MTREQELEQIILDISWMARRYADGRATYAVATYNNAIAKAIKLGVIPDADKGEAISVWAFDYSFGWPAEYVEKYGHNPRGTVL